MSGIDKALLMEKLKALGWKETDEDGWNLSPPESLWINKPKSFYVYDAELLQELLSDTKK